MTLTTLLIGIAITAAILTAIIGGLKKQKNWVMTYVQNFCGSLFLISGYVKAVDPLGTAYKLEQYFSEFEYTFADSAMSFIAPVFPLLAQYGIAFSVFMIIFEIVLGLMLIIGAKPKLTSWAFFLLVAFFTVLTGFTFLTGYVPQGVNFFEFSAWGEYVESNMKVTDCGCFGDFLVLKPKTSFLKDVFLLMPSIYFIWRYKDMHELFTSSVRTAILGGSTVLLLLYCMSNYAWNIPGQDFRPFKVGTDVRATKEHESEAANSVKVIGYKLTNKKSGNIVELNTDDFLKKYKEYPKAEWQYEQVKTEPAIKATKISDYAITNEEGADIADELLAQSGYSMMIVSYKLKGEADSKQIQKKFPVYEPDTIKADDGTESIIRKMVGEEERTISETSYKWDPNFAKSYKEIVNPMMAAAEKAGLKVYGVAGGAGAEMIEDFRHATQAAYPIYEADDILLKTIVRSNPGIVLWKDGKVIQKWHYKKLPSFEEIKAEYIK